MPVATQLSLFGDDDVPESSPLSASPTAKSRPRKKRALKLSAEAMAPVAAPLFDDDSFDSVALADAIAEAPTALAASALLPPEPPPLALRVPPPPVSRRNIDEESGLPPSRIVFDAKVWELRADRGDFIHIHTGEIRDEDGFVFPALDADQLTAALDDWDIPQIVPRKAKDRTSPDKFAPGR